MKEKRNNLKRKKLYLILAILLVLLSCFMLWNILKEKGIIPLKTMTAYTTLTVGNHTGFDLNKTVLSFGTITNGTSSSRNITINNNYDFPVRFEFDVQGNISKFLVYSKNIYLNPKEEKSIMFLTHFVSNETFGEYSGRIIMKVKKTE